MESIKEELLAALKKIERLELDIEALQSQILNMKNSQNIFNTMTLEEIQMNATYLAQEHARLLGFRKND